MCSHATQREAPSVSRRWAAARDNASTGTARAYPCSLLFRRQPAHPGRPTLPAVACHVSPQLAQPSSLCQPWHRPCRHMLSGLTQALVKPDTGLAEVCLCCLLLLHASVAFFCCMLVLHASLVWTCRSWHQGTPNTCSQAARCLLQSTYTGLPTDTGQPTATQHLHTLQAASTFALDGFLDGLLVLDVNLCAYVHIQYYEVVFMLHPHTENTKHCAHEPGGPADNHRQTITW